MTSTPLTFRLRRAEDVIAAAAVVLGFHPADSLVMITAEGDHVFHGRTDLPSRPDPGAAAALAEQMLAPAVRNGVRRVVFVFFSADERVVRRVWGALRRAAAEHGIDVAEAVRADGRRWFALRGERRLREIGVPYDVATHPFVVSAVLHGLVIEKDRAAVVARAAPDPAAQQAVERVVGALGLRERPPPSTGADRAHWGRWLREQVAAHVSAGTVASDEDLAMIGWAAQDLRVRDAAWALIDRRHAAAHQAFWLDVTRRAPDRLAPAAAALLGWAAWQAGNGALAWVAVDRCRELSPDYGMAVILARCLEQAIPPDSFEAGFAWDEGLPA